MPGNKIIFLLIVFIIISAGAVIYYLGASNFSGKISSEQNHEKVYNVTALYTGGVYERAIAGLRDQLYNDGFIEGKNLNLHIIKLEGGLNEIEGTINAQSIEKTDLFYTISTPVTSRTWKAVGDTKPIIFNIVGDPVGAGFIKEYKSSETNLTGCSNSSAELSGKRLEIFKEAFPDIKKIATIYDPTNAFSLLSIEITREAARILGIEIAELLIKDSETLESLLLKMQPGDYDGFYITPDASVVSNIEMVITRTNELKIPTIGHEDSLAEKGVTLIYGADFYDLGVQCASIVEAVFRGKEPKMIPVMTPTKLEIVVNQKNCIQLGVFPAPSILGRSDHIIK